MSRLLRGCKRRGMTRDQQQCRVKVKELQQMYQKARKANNWSSAEPQTCCSCKDRFAILGGDPTITPSTEDISEELESQVPAVNSEEEYGRQVTGGIQLHSEDLFLIPPQSSQSRLLIPGKPIAGCCHCNPGSPLPYSWSQIRRRKRRTQDDIFNEILQACTALHHEHRAWRMNFADTWRRKEWRRKAQESQQDKETEMHQDIMRLLRQQTQMLQTLVQV
ncbi:uncharacterized protein RBU57_012054 [Macrochelys suwanniensis]